MTKADIVNEVAKKTGYEKVQIQAVIEDAMEEIKKAMKNGDDVFLRGFGSFVVKKRKQKTARNITKNTTIVVPEHFVPDFKPAKSFVEQVKNNVKEQVKNNVK